MVSDIELLKNMEEIRIKTILQNKMKIFGNKESTSNEVIAKISEVQFSEKDKPNSPIIRIIVGDKRFYLHKNMSRVQDFELLKAVFSPNVARIKCF